jgi:hypothetical protein
MTSRAPDAAVKAECAPSDGDGPVPCIELPDPLPLPPVPPLIPAPGYYKYVPGLTSSMVAVLF